MLWWIALHLLVAASIPWLGLNAAAAAGLAALIGAHGIVRRPFLEPPELWIDGAGLWSLPQLALVGLALGPRTRYTTLWIELSLVSARRRIDLMLLADQFDAETWRQLQVRLRRSHGAAAAARHVRTRDLR